tara:strand:+ start:37 stop:228 length:192 start_codon:yes stop_codon:yes gene_type:complete
MLQITEEALNIVDLLGTEDWTGKQLDMLLGQAHSLELKSPLRQAIFKIHSDHNSKEKNNRRIR